MLNFLMAIDHKGRWILAVLMLLFIITGFGMTKNIIDPQLARQLHVNVLPPLFYVLLMIHIVIPLRAHCVRWKLGPSERGSAAYAYLIAAVFLVFFFWVHFR